MNFVIKSFLCLAALAASLLAQAPDMTQAEQESLRMALAEAGNSPVDFVRALENHLNKYPNSPRLGDLERALIKSSTDIKDDDRVIKYGERLLKREPDDVQVLERVSTSLLRKSAKPEAERALQYSKRFLELLQASTTEKPSDKPTTGRDEVKVREGMDRATSRAFLLQARAQGTLEAFAKASDLAELSFSTYPSVESAREASRWLAAQNRNEEAVRYLAKAFTITELKSPDSEAARDRVRMGELYRKWKGSDTGLGDLVLQAYDQTAAAFSARREQLRQIDPNTDAKEPMQFTVTSVAGDKLSLASLKGKVVVMDFWATWCGPCRIQHPLYEEVKQRFKDRDDVVFLAIDTDEDRTLVKPFLEKSNWSQKVYYEDGLGRVLQVSSIPTTIIFNKKGEVASRMNGFVPERFVDMLSDRIREALGDLGPVKVAVAGQDRLPFRP